LAFWYSGTLRGQYFLLSHIEHGGKQVATTDTYPTTSAIAALQPLLLLSLKRSGPSLWPVIFSSAEVLSITGQANYFLKLTISKRQHAHRG